MKKHSLLLLESVFSFIYLVRRVSTLKDEVYKKTDSMDLLDS